MDKVIKIFFSNELLKSEIYDVTELFNEQHEKLNNIRTLLGKGSFGAVYKYGNNYVEKEYFNIKNLSEITKEILLFSAFYQRGVYVRFNGSKFNVYFPIVGNVDLKDLLKGENYNFYDILNIDFELLLKEISDLHKNGIYHMDLAPKNVCVLTDSKSDKIYKPYLIDFGASTTVTRIHEDFIPVRYNLIGFARFSDEGYKNRKYAFTTVKGYVCALPAFKGLPHKKRVEIFSKYKDFYQKSIEILEEKGSNNKKRSLLTANDYFSLALIAADTYQVLNNHLKKAEAKSLPLRLGELGMRTQSGKIIFDIVSSINTYDFSNEADFIEYTKEISQASLKFYKDLISDIKSIKEKLIKYKHKYNSENDTNKPKYKESFNIFNSSNAKVISEKDHDVRQNVRERSNSIVVHQEDFQPISDMDESLNESRMLAEELQKMIDVSSKEKRNILLTNLSFFSK